MASSAAASMLARALEVEDPARTLLKTQMAEGLKHFRKVKAQRTGEPHIRSNYNDILKRLQKTAPRALDPRGPDPRGPIGLEIVFVEAPYPPCTLAPKELEHVLLSELTLNSHHRGKILLGKLVGVVDVTWKNILAVIEDTSGDVEFLDLHFMCMKEKTAHTWPKLGSWLAIKEPFLTLDEINVTECVRIDHPSDLVFAETWSPGLAKVAGLSSAFLEHTLLEWKELGNAALATKNFDAAYTSYTQGLRAVATKLEKSERVIEKDLYRNRSCVGLALGRYEGAVTDALAALTHLSDDTRKRLDAKAYFRAAHASYNLKHYEKAVSFLRDQLELFPDDRDGMKLLERSETRLLEHRYGCYNIANIQRSLSRGPRVDVADYITNTTVKTSGPGRGRGLFATRDFQPGNLVMAETSYCCVWRREDANLLVLEAMRAVRTSVTRTSSVFGEPLSTKQAGTH
jgi:tetratricopeptide (TPR) repeat protein